MSESHSHSSHASHTSHTSHSTHNDSAMHSAASAEHHMARAARSLDSKVYEMEVLSSGNPKRIERYFVRRFAYKLFGRFMAKTINKI